MRILLIVLLAWLARRLAKKVRARRAHRKLVRQLKDLGVYGGTMCVKNTGSPAAPPPALSAKPGSPVPFGYKTAWLAVRCQDPRQAAAALSRPHRERASWEAGLSCSLEPGGAVFFSPVMDDFVLAIGYELFALTEQQDKLEALAALFPEVQYFSSHRVSSSYLLGPVSGWGLCAGILCAGRSGSSLHRCADTGGAGTGLRRLPHNGWAGYRPLAR